MAVDIMPVNIDTELAAIIDGAYESGKPIMVSYVDNEGQPHLSFRGSTQEHSADQIAMWIREANGGLVSALPNNNRMTMMYRDSENKVSYLFYGRAQVATDPTVIKAIYDKTPKGERDKDPDMVGVAIVIDIDEIQGGTAAGRVRMRRP